MSLIFQKTIISKLTVAPSAVVVNKYSLGSSATLASLSSCPFSNLCTYPGISVETLSVYKVLGTILANLS